MTEGRIVETGPTAALLERPRAPYTQQLLANTPSIAAAEGPATATA
jgi:ABC-type dipeptide/oligopeptide/nickel transport system ATPase component